MGKIHNILKGASYTANALAKPVVNSLAYATESDFFNKLSNTDLGSSVNILSGIGFAALDVLGVCSDKVKDSKFTGISKFLGALYFTGAATLDLLSMANNDMSAGPGVALNSSMAYSCIKDLYDTYSVTDKDLLKDLQFWKR